MRNKLVKARPHSDQKPAFSIHQDDTHSMSLAPALRYCPIFSADLVPCASHGKVHLLSNTGVTGVFMSEYGMAAFARQGQAF
jgi:hypothetical protein